MRELTTGSFEGIACPSEQLGHGEAEALGRELAPLPPSEPRSPPAPAPCHSQLLFSTLQLGRRLIWLELERHRWYQGTVSKHTSCCKPWSFCRCLQNGFANSLCSGKGKRRERHRVLKLLILSQCNFLPLLFLKNIYSVDSQVPNSFPLSYSSKLN